MVSWIPQDPFVRKVLCNAWPMHFARVFLRSTMLTKMPLHPDEKYIDAKMVTPTIRIFLCWRRSVLFVFVGLAFLIIAMGSVYEAPEIVRVLLMSEEEEVNHESVSRTITLLNALSIEGGTPNQASQAPGTAIDAARRNLMSPYHQTSFANLHSEDTEVFVQTQHSHISEPKLKPYAR